MDLSPDVSIIAAVGSPFDTPMAAVWAIAFACVPLFFAMSIIREQAQVIKGETPKFNVVLWDAFLIICGLMMYKFIFRKVLGFCELISVGMYDSLKWDDFLVSIADSNKTLGIGGIITSDVLTVISCLFLAICSIAETILLTVRYSILVVIYVVGPLAFAFYLFGPTKKMLKGWFNSLLQVSFWIVILRIVESTILSFGVSQLVTPASMTENLLASAICIALLIAVPFITQAILSGENIGMAGSAIVAGATMLASGGSMKAIQAGMGSAKSVAGGFLRGQLGQQLANSKVGKSVSNVGKAMTQNVGRGLSNVLSKTKSYTDGHAEEQKRKKDKTR